MEINRYLRKEKINKQGLAPIRISVNPYKKRIWLESGEKVSLKGWDDAKQRVRRTEPYAMQINDRLQEWEEAIMEVYRQLQKEKRFVTEQEFKALVIQELNGIQEEEVPQLSFHDHLDAWIEMETTKVSGVTQGEMSIITIRAHKSTRARLKAYETKRKITLTLEGMSPEFYQDFKRYMLVELKQSVNTFTKHIRRLKRFLAWCDEEGHQVNRKFRSFSTPSKKAEVESLSQEELIRLQNLDFKSDQVVWFVHNLKGEAWLHWSLQRRLDVLEKMRDVFLMMCYTGLRISDMFKLSPNHINGDIIEIRAIKTKITCYIPFYDDELFKPVTLVKKYEGRQPTCLPVYKKINFFLKTIQQLAELERFPLKTKNGRKTFVTLKLYQGVPARIVMQATGHQTENAFNHYAGINTQALVSSFQKHSTGVQVGVQL